MSVAFITAKKYVKDGMKDVFYLGNKQTDGYIYFNDETYYRCLTDGSVLQLLYPSKQNWVITNNLQELSVFDFSPEGIVGAIGDLVNGQGSVAPNANVEKAVTWAIAKAAPQNIGYAKSYEERTKSLNNVNARAYDCSSFVITAFTQAGFKTGATYTGDMRSAFTALGFKWLPGNRWPESACLRGDILLNEKYHTQIFVGDGKDANCGSNPCRLTTHNEYYTGFGARGWDGILRYGG